MEQQIQFCTSSDGVRIAYATVGQGPALVCPPPWVSHLEVEWQWPTRRAFWERLAQRHTVVRYDRYGCGLSDRERTDFSLDADLRPLEAVVDHLELRRFALLSIAQAGPHAIAYAVKHPERVSHLILFDSYGSRGRIDPAQQQTLDAMQTLAGAHWEFACKTMACAFIPGADAADQEGFARLLSESETGEMAVQLIEHDRRTNVVDLLPRVGVPTLVMHRREDPIIAFHLGREMAASISNARFVPLEGNSHNFNSGDAEAVLRAISEFLSEPSQPGLAAPPYPDGLTEREIEVLGLIATGRSNQEIAEELVLSVRTVERHITNTYGKIKARGRADATAYALAHGLAQTPPYVV